MTLRIDERDVRQAELTTWLDDFIDQIRWQRRNGAWTPEARAQLLALEQTADAVSDWFRGDQQ